MQRNISIKANKKGISVYLSPDIDFELLMDEFKNKLFEACKFFDNAEVILSLEGRILSAAETHRLLSIIDQFTEMKVIGVVDNNDYNEIAYNNVLKDLLVRLNADSCEIYSRSVKNDKSVNFEHSVIIIGNVDENAEIHSNGSVFVLGELNGSVYAGEQDNKKAVVYAGKMNPKYLSISDISFVNNKERKKGFLAKIRNNNTEELLNRSVLVKRVGDKIEAVEFK